MGVAMRCQRIGERKHLHGIYLLSPFYITAWLEQKRRHVAILQSPPIQPLYETEKALSGFLRAWGRSCEGVANPLLGIGSRCDWLSLWEKKA
jgi:hypothetical protein